MAQAFDAFVQFDIWEALDEDSLRLTQTSEFWTQVQYEADRLDLVPPADYSEPMQECDEDWSIIDAPEEPRKENIVHHDCMWAGQCVDSVHPSNTFVPADPAEAPATPGQSLLRRDTTSPSRPETPPSIDGDEPPQFRHSVDVAGTALRLLRDSAVVAADHSYTLARRHLDHLGVQTPSDSCESAPVSPDRPDEEGVSQPTDSRNEKLSDGTSSEEEIDVVSVGTAQPLPAAPTHVRTESLPRAPSAQERVHIQRSVEVAISPRAPRSPRPAARKRLVPPPSIAASSSRRRIGQFKGRRRGRRSNSDSESETEAPEKERRSMHNDMERMRRIGLKNLFDHLKDQIPTTKDKERAPKVVILREAATLCVQLTEEEIERQRLLKKQAALTTRLRKLRATLDKKVQEKKMQARQHRASNY